MPSFRTDIFFGLDQVESNIGAEFLVLLSWSQYVRSSWRPSTGLVRMLDLLLPLVEATQEESA